MIKSNNMIDIKNLINEFRNETLLEKEKVFIDGKDKKSVITGSKILTLALTKENIIYTIYQRKAKQSNVIKSIKENL
ncbi:hypothetical protein [Acinetobacter baumannii]|uniref:hypothetical protein n=1 Tax=Acinetobacter baumannii TaxID=470 RepID=UPI000A67F40F|nr:hypothetical protein [Acinetobacter baumannii]